MNLKQHILILMLFLASGLNHVSGQERGAGLRLAYSPWSRQEISLGVIIAKPSENRLMEWPIGYTGISLTGGYGKYENEIYYSGTLSGEYHEKFFCAKCSVRQTNIYNKSEYSVIPEIGVTGMGLISLTYAYNIPVTATLMNATSRHQLNLNVTIPLYFW